MAEPQQKKIKVADNEIFYSFRKDERKVKALTLALNSLLFGQPTSNLHLLRVCETNACSPSSFKSTCCYCKDLDSEAGQTKPQLYAIGSVFRVGTLVLEEYLTKEEPSIPKDGQYRAALKNLLEFLSFPCYTSLITRLEGVDEDGCEWAVRASKHLLSKLSLDDKYVIDDTNCHDRELKAKFKDVFGDTSFGVPGFWHGCADILMQVPVAVKQPSLDADDEDSDEETYCLEQASSAVELKTGKNFSDSDLNKILAQTIVFSFLQKKLCTDLKHSLIPSVAITHQNVKVHFYDSVNDILLESSQLPIFIGSPEDGNFQGVYTKTIVILWLTLNYKLFCTGVTKKMKDHRSCFHDCVKDKLDIYRYKVKMPYRLEKTTLIEREYWSLLEGESEDPAYGSLQFESLLNFSE